METVPCKWKPVEEYGFAARDEKKRDGRYHGSMFWDVKGFGSKRWVVAGQLDLDAELKQRLDQGVPERQLVEACLQFLNQPPPREKFQRKTSRPLYGNLEYYRHRLKKDCIEVLVITDQKKNDRFWSEGTIVNS